MSVYRDQSTNKKVSDPGLLQAASTLLLPLIRREVTARYRGSVLGILWSLLTPLFMLAVFTFVFGAVFRARWVGASENASVAEFSVILFAGLIIFNLFSEVINRAPSLIIANQNYVKKIVFPLEILVPVALGSALFHAAVSLVVLLVFILAVHGAIPWTALLLPLVVLPLCLMILGLSWFLASFGTFVRDVGQVLGPIVTAIMFLSPIFFPISSLPHWIQPWVMLNPIAVPITEAREVLVFGNIPDFASLGVYSVVGVIIAYLGYSWFKKTSKGFSDVL